MRRALLLIVLAAGCAAPLPPPMAPPVHTDTAPRVAPASAPIITPDAVVAALMSAARAAMALPEQIEVTVGGTRWACFRWPLEELLRGRINSDTLWQVYVRELRTDGRKLDFEVR